PTAIGLWRATYPDTSKRGFRAGGASAASRRAFVVTVCVSARGLLSVFASISGRPSQAAERPGPHAIHLPAGCSYFRRNTGGHRGCARRPQALYFGSPLRPSTTANLARRSLRTALGVDRHVDPAGCVIAIPDLA